MPACFYLVFILFFTGICRCETETCAVFHITQRACEKISFKCFTQGHNNAMPSTGIEPATLHCYQLNYAAALRFEDI